MSALATLLRGVTILIELLGLGLTVWLGLALVSQVPRRATSWLAAALCWGFSAVFALNLLQLGRPLVPARPWLPYEILRWVLIPLPLVWLWVLQALLPARVRPLLKRMRQGGAVLTLVLIAIAGLTRPWIQASEVDWTAWAWLFYPFFLLAALATVGPSIALTWRSARLAHDPARRDSGYALTVATVLALLSAFYRVGGWWLWPALPALPGDLALLSAVIALGLGLVLRDIADGRTNAAAFVYSLTNASAITLLYVLAVGAAAALLEISWLVLIPVVALAAATHWLADWSRGLFDAFFYREPIRRLRSDLRTLVRTLDRAEQLGPQLRPALERLARQTDASLVVLAIPKGDEPVMQVVASYPPLAENTELPRAPLTLAGRAPVRLPPPGGGAARSGWGVPLPDAGGPPGTLAIWPGAARGLNDLDLAFLEEVGGQLAILLATWQVQDTRRVEIERLLAAYRAEAETLQAQIQALAGGEAGESGPLELESRARGWMDEVLRHLHDVAYLGQHPVARLRLIDARLGRDRDGTVTHLERGQAVRQLCEELIERLRPPGALPAEPYGPEWRLYAVLYLAYVEGVPNREIMSRLAIGEGTFHRARRQALESLAEALVELERATPGSQIASSPPPSEARGSVPPDGAPGPPSTQKGIE